MGICKAPQIHKAVLLAFAFGAATLAGWVTPSSFRAVGKATTTACTKDHDAS